MNRYRKLLIPADGSRETLKEGLRIALDEHCLIIVLKVFPPYEGDLHLTGIKNIKEVLGSCRDREVKEIKEIIREEGAIARVIVAEGAWQQTIQRIVREEGCDLIIMGNRSSGRLRRFFAGNLLERIGRPAPCPVLVI